MHFFQLTTYRVHISVFARSCEQGLQSHRFRYGLESCESGSYWIAFNCKTSEHA